MRVIALVNQKGGVGKTTLSINMAAILADLGYKVLLIDNDSQSNVTNTFLTEEPSKTLYNVMLRDIDLKEVIQNTGIKNLDIAVNSLESSDLNLLLGPKVAREMKLKNAIVKSKIDYDFVFIDCNPSLDLSMINALVAANEVIIPIDSSAYSLTGLNNLIKFINDVKVLNSSLEINGFVLNNVDRRTALYKEVADVINQYYPEKLFKQQIGQNVIFNKMQFKKETIINHKDNKAYEELVKLISEVI
ncbi:AAA family ATPase [Clostridium perfringens]|jgi:chromosome partitioning protein|nr:AAA family ATPase [Clostridium perfringens]MCI2780443.1 AAA family ATPase [Clostridium perfringens]MDJ8948185.1 AAA family ATPase [Clostridium perfringens]MDK0530698.1 AAA family ATPase [Clostridium perfringens]MDK0545356.1 AAA family ATPase [Clostridium perfringens]MDK0557457.1 AAA family ATPase [Clostridium perfringens]